MIGQVLGRLRYTAAIGALALVVSQNALESAAAQINPGSILRRGLDEILKQGNRDRQARERDRLRRERQQPSSPERPNRTRPDPLAAPSRAAECDRLAGHPADPLRRGPGVADEKIDLVAGLEACAAAVAQNKTEPRLLFQAGRVLWLAEEFDEAMPFLLDAAEAKEPAALAYMGDAYANGLGGAEENLETALGFYVQAAEAGYAPADEAADEVAVTIAEATPIQQIAATTKTAAELNDCDRLAAHPADPKKVGVGIADENVDADKAIAACEAVRSQFPNTPRLDYQYGRALYLANRQSEALPVLAGAAENGYAAAKAVVADAYLEGAGGAEQDIGAAYAFYQEAAAGEFKPALASVGELQKAFAAPPSSASNPKLRLSCEVQATRSGPTYEPFEYVNFKFAVVLDFNTGKATFSGENPTVETSMFSTAKNYDFFVDDNNAISLAVDPIGPEVKDSTFTVSMADGKAYMQQTYKIGELFTFPIVNHLLLQGYCGEAAAPAPRAQPVKRSTKKRS